MGKKSKKITKKIKQANQGQTSSPMNTTGNPARQKKINALIKQVYQCKDEGKYEDGLLAVIDLFEMDYAQTDMVYETAELYYLTGDYERAVGWGIKTLSFEKNHLSAMLLLAKIYAIQNQSDLCLDMLNKLLKANKLQLSAEAKDEVDDLLDYLETDYDEEILQDKYSMVWKYLKTEETEIAVEESESFESPEDNLVVESMSETSEKAVALEMHTQEVAATNIPPAEVQLEAETLCPIEEPAILEQTTEAFTLDHIAEKAVFNEQETECLTEEKIEDVIASIMNQPVSLQEKVGLCNYFAAYYYERDDIERIIPLLNQALEIDGKNDLVLKNLGFMLSQCGEKKAALEYLMCVQSKDLMVLDMIKKLKQ